VNLPLVEAVGHRVATHWVRFGLFTTYAILCLYMLAKSAIGAQLRSA
jgi:hypothetical protein